MKRAAETIINHAKRPNSGHGPALMWFRSDLRAHDNPALSAASEFCGTDGGLQALFLVDAAEWRRHDMAACKVEFMLRNVQELRQLLHHDFNIPLHVLRRDGGLSVANQIGEFCQKHNIHNVFLNHEYEVDESRRDKDVIEHLHKLDITCTLFHDQCVVKPGTLRTKTGQTPFTVFTPFKKAWIEELRVNPYVLSPPPIRQKSDSCEPIGDLPSVVFDLPEYKDLQEQYAGMIEHCIKTWPAGEKSGMKRVEVFCEERLKTYKDNRDFPKLDQTSRLSAYLSLGVVSARQCLDKALTANGMRYDTGSEGAVHWISELCWREFYRHIMFDFPRVSMAKPFKLDTERVPWRRLSDPAASEDFEAWRVGKTGYPLVDAAMRCLAATGWMHNRLRMLTAMFLTKDLLIWWPEGERIFMNMLIDGDLASNNGGWQWSASTGTDSQPYFRIFNPILQSEKFDSDGAFIKQWVPELAGVPAAAVHEPFKKLSRKEFEKLGYPKPIVDHYEARDRCLAAFKSIK